MFKVLLLPAVLATFSVATTFAAEPVEDFRFKIETLVEGALQPMQVERAPDGRLFFIEIAGKLKIYRPDTQQLVEAGTLAVTNAQENGLLGMALDPHFAQNGWIYLLHSPKDFDGQFISRFSMQGDTLDPTSRKDLLKWPEQRRECCHHAGALRFGPDGCLYASTGDNTNPFQSDGFSPHDGRPNRDPWDAQKSSANTNDLRGKILRIKPKADGTYEIPVGNLFAPGTPDTRPEIFAMGFRNPWRFSVDRQTGIVYVGDVGPDSGQHKDDRGPSGFDTINQLRGPGYFGWPYARGHKVYRTYDFDAKTSGAEFDPLKPVNTSPNNTGRRELPPVQAPLVWYPGGESKEFPLLGKGGRTACAGPVFHFDPKFRETGGFPEQFDNCLVIYDWQRPFVYWARLDADSRLTTLEPFTSAVRVAQGDDDGSGRFQIRRPVDMFFGPDGALYLFDYGETWGANKDSRLVRISYQRGNLAPLAKATATNTTGREPLTVLLSAEGSKDHEGDALRYEWRLQPANKIVAAEAQAKVTIAEPGNYLAELKVTDAKGASATARVPLAVGNTAPEVRFEEPQDGDFFTPGKPVSFKVAVRDLEDGDSAAKPDEFGFRTLASASWKRADGKGAEVAPGLTLMKQSDCFNCHAVDQKLIGPSLLEVAQKYRGQAGAELTAVNRILHGSTGVWGQVGMLPHPTLIEDQVHIMVRWIFSLEPGKGSPGLVRGLAGQIVAPKDDKVTGCIIEATYADAGRAPAGSLSGRATITLRARRIEAEQGDEISGPQILGAGNAGGKRALGAVADKHFVRLARINLADTASARLRVASGGQGGRIELRAGSVTGELIGSVEVTPTGAWDNWVELKTPLQTGAATRADVFLVFTNPGKGGLMNLDWIQFDPR